MADMWQSLRDDLRSTRIGETFGNALLGTSPELASTLDGDGVKQEVGGTLFFSDSPESLTGAVALAGGGTLQGMGFNAILFTDTAPLQAGVRYRYFVHHLNNTGHARRIGVRVANHGASPSVLLTRGFARVEVGPVTAAAERLTRAVLDAIPAAASSFDQPDELPDSPATDAPAVPQFNNSEANAVEIVARNLPVGQLMTGIIDFTVEGPDLRVYTVIGDPPASAYLGEDRTATQQDIHGRGTFPLKTVTRFVPGDVAIDTGLEEPRVFWVVARDEGPFPRDTDWVGEDRCLGGTIPGQNAGNYGRLHLIRIRFTSSAAAGGNVALVANPRTPGSDFFGFVRDVGAARSVRVPSAGVVHPGDNGRGTVVWKGHVASAQEVLKRLCYTTTGASAGKLNLWVVPYGGDLES